MDRDRETEIASLVRALGRDAERTAPAFDRMWRAALAQVHAPTSVWSPLRGGLAIATVAAFVVVAMTLWSEWRHDRPLDLASAQWRSPTASLLALPGDQWLKATPRPIDSTVPDLAATLTIQRR